MTQSVVKCLSYKNKDVCFILQNPHFIKKNGGRHGSSSCELSVFRSRQVEAWVLCRAIWAILAILDIQVILATLAYFEILRSDMDLRNNTRGYPLTYKHIYMCTHTYTHAE